MTAPTSLRHTLPSARSWQARLMPGTGGRDAAAVGRPRWWRSRVQDGAGLAAALVGRANRYPLAADAALALLLALGTLPDAVGRNGGGTALALHVALWLPVVFRRRAPLVVFGILAAIAFVQWLTGIELAADLALLIALYTVAAHRRRGRALLAASVLEIGVVLATLTWGHEDGPVRTFVQLSGVVVAALLLGTTVQSRQRGYAVLQERAERLERERDQQAAIAAAGERARIAREMHDIVAHSLSVMITLADGARMTDRAEDARAAMAQVSRTGRDALADTRRVLGVLRDDESAATRQPAPTIATLDTLLDTVRSTGLTVDMTVHGRRFDVTPTAQTALYRIVQEALTNTVKHAGASRAEVGLEYDDPALRVRITDDGPDTGHRGRGTGHGILGIGERAALFGGSAQAGPGPGGGWQVTATLARTHGPAA
ncbi:sensor histidine kinase [Nakamurella flavida]|uniref:histidine kinase n=1 Tax=Nakamurella flavida TaxID=363630 RepID=A0A938YLG8_9ACTN|nr:histidine kinase [Nakamurella flavida]MBM9477354.1 sensor histidine kinase [Nakamurella flavida]MDP9777286.1 signal transduction histidine kinase [Nakamurella flavida]